MQIKLTVGASELVIVHGSGSPSDTYAQGPMGSELNFDSSVAVNSIPLIRSDFPLITNGKNVGSVFQVTAMRVFSTKGGAQVWGAKHAKDLLIYDTLVITNDDASTTTLTGAIESCRPIVLGVAVTINYSFRYGRVQ